MNQLNEDSKKLKEIYETLTKLYKATLEVLGYPLSNSLLKDIETNRSENAFNWMAAQRARELDIRVRTYMENTGASYLILTAHDKSAPISIENILDVKRRISDGSSGEPAVVDFEDFFEETNISDIDEAFMAAVCDLWLLPLPLYVEEDYNTIDAIHDKLGV